MFLFVCLLRQDKITDKRITTEKWGKLQPEKRQTEKTIQEGKKQRYNHF